MLYIKYEAFHLAFLCYISTYISAPTILTVCIDIALQMNRFVYGKFFTIRYSTGRDV